MKTLTKIIGTLALAGLAFLPSCNTKAQQEAEKKMQEEKISIYDKFIESYGTINKESKKLEASLALAECRDNLASAIEFQKKYFEDEQIYAQTMRLITMYNLSQGVDARKSDLAGLNRANRYLNRAREYTQSLSKRIDSLVELSPKIDLEKAKNASEFETVIKLSKDYQALLSKIESCLREDSSYMDIVSQYAKTKTDEESVHVYKLAGAIKEHKDSLYKSASKTKENLTKSTKKLQENFADCVSEFLPEKKIDTVETHEY